MVLLYCFRQNADEEATHKANIAKRCRVCGIEIVKDGSPKHLYAEEMRRYGVNIDLDDESIHPQLVCNPHKAVFYRTRTALAKGCTYRTNMTFIEFHPHSEGCVFCYPSLIPGDHSYSSTLKCKRRKYNNPKSNYNVVITPELQPLQSTKDNSECLDIKLKIKSLPKDDFSQLLMDLIMECDEEMKLKILELLCKDNATDIMNAVKSANLLYKDISVLTNIDIDQYINDYNAPFIKTFIETISNDDFKASDKGKYMIGRTLENISALVQPKTVLPLSFMANLSLLQCTGSRASVDKASYGNAGGCSETINRWLEEQATNPPTCPPGDIGSIFDNQQVLHSRYQIVPENKIQSSVLCNHLWVQMTPDGVLQKDKSFKPKNWLNIDGFESKISDIRQWKGDHFSSLETVHAEQVMLFINSAIASVYNEQVINADGSISDHIDNIITQQQIEKLYVVCQFCGAQMQRRCRLCACGKSLQHSRDVLNKTTQNKYNVDLNSPRNTKVIFENEENEDESEEENEEQDDRKYAHVVHHHPEVQPVLHLADPIFLNPNSFKNVASVLRTIGKKAGIKRYGGDVREWTVVCSDGLPFNLMLKLLEETRCCNICNLSFFGDDIRKHFKESHPNE